MYFPCLKIELNRRLFVCLPCCCLRAELAVNPGLQCQSRELDNCTIHSTLLPCLWYMKQHFLSIGLIQAANKVSFKMYLAKQIHILCKCCVNVLTLKTNETNERASLLLNIVYQSKYPLLGIEITHYYHNNVKVI